MSVRSGSRTPGGFSLLPLHVVAVLSLEVSLMAAMSTGDYTDTVSDQPPVIGECMQLLTPSFQKIFDLEQICHELDQYLACYVDDVRKTAAYFPGPLPLDLFHDVHSTNAAYQGVCQDLPAITPNRHCVQEKELELRKCNDGLNAVSSHLETNYYDVETSTQYLCRAFQVHAICESLALTSCDEKLGHAMANFYIAALPTTCKILLGVSSKYDDIIFGPFWMGIPVECFPKDADAHETSVGTTYSKLCRHYETFVPCLEDVVHKRNRTGLLYDVGAYDLFDQQSQLNAYRAFCPLVTAFADDLECVQRTNLTISESCSNGYSEAAYELENPQLSVQDKRNIMCKATVGLLKCEQQAYTSCTDDIITAYNNYNVAILPGWCKNLVNIASPFDQMSVEVTTKTTVPVESTTIPTTEKRLATDLTSAVTKVTTNIPGTVDSRTEVHPEFMPAYTTDNSQQKLRTSCWLVVVVTLVLLFT